MRSGTKRALYYRVTEIGSTTRAYSSRRLNVRAGQREFLFRRQHPSVYESGQKLQQSSQRQETQIPS